MSTLTITNNTAERVLVQELYNYVPASGTLATQRTAADIQAMPAFLQQVADGTLSYALTADNVAEALAAERAESMLDLGAPAAPVTTAVHASYNADEADNNFPGPFTDPDVPRGLTVTFAGTWDGGDVTVNGTDQFGNSITETFASNPGGATAGVKAFATVTSASKAAVGAAAVGASIGTGTVLGLPIQLTGATGNLLFADGVGEAGTWDTTNHAVDPTTAPDGSVEFVVLAKLS